MTSRRALAFWGGVVLLAGTLLARPQDPLARLEGSAAEGVVQLRWEPLRWPDGLRAFEVRRREKGGPWTPVAGPIAPGFGPDRDLAAVESDAQARARLVARRTKELQPGRLKPMSADEFVAAAREGKADFFRMLRVTVLDDPDLAYLYGFACSDRSALPKGDWEYGLFAVHAAAAAEPAATWTPSPAAALDGVALSVARAIDRSVLRWTAPDAVVRARGIGGFRVYRAPLGSTAFKPAADRRISSSKVDRGLRVYTFVDVPGGNFSYAVAACDALGRELPGRATADTPVAAAPTVPAPVVTSTRTEGGRLVLAWEFQKAQEASITGFRVEAGVFPDGEPKALPGILPPTAREAVDPEARKPDVGYGYRVLALRGEEVLAVSAPYFLMTLAPSPAPPSPRNLRASLIQAGEKTSVLLAWDASEGADAYLLYTDAAKAGTPSLRADVPPIRAVEHAVDLDLAVGREVTFGVSALGKGGGESDRAEVRLPVPGALPEAVKDLKVGDDGAVTWAWTSPEPGRGFRVSWAGGLLAELGPEARSFMMPPSPQRVEVVVRAISSSGALSAPAKAEFSPSGAVGVLRPLPPKDLKAVRLGDKLTLTWTPDPKVKKWRVDTDLGTPGFFHSSRDVTAARHSFDADPARSATARVFGLSEKNEPGLASEVLSLGADRTLPPAVLATQARLHREAAGIVAEWTWRYPAAPELAGFRILVDGKVVADEKTLGPDLRSWTSPPLERRRQYRFEIEAVDKKGKASERGYHRELIHFQR